MLTMIIICTIRINDVTDEKIELNAESVVCLHPGNAFSTGSSIFSLLKELLSFVEVYLRSQTTWEIFVTAMFESLSQHKFNNQDHVKYFIT